MGRGSANRPSNQHGGRLQTVPGPLKIIAEHRPSADRLQLVASSLSGFIPALEQTTWLGPLVVTSGPAAVIDARPWTPVIQVPPDTDRATVAAC